MSNAAQAANAEQAVNGTSIPPWVRLGALFGLAATSIGLFAKTLTDSIGYAEQQPYWNILGAEFTKSIGISFGLLFIFFVVCLIYFLQDNAAGIRVLFVVCGLVFMVSFSAVAMSAFTS